MEKKTKMENLKARINRCSLIINSLESLPQALTIKSTKFYPQNKDLFYRSIYYEDICDFKLMKNFLNPKYEINNKMSNQNHVLGKKPDGSLEDVTLTQGIMNTIDSFKEIKNEFNLSNFKDLFDKQEIQDDIERYNSVFQFYDKSKVYCQKSHSEIIRESTLLNNFMKSNKNRFFKKLQEAPVSITEKIKMTKFKPKKELIRRNTANINIDLKLPENINLPLISQFEIQTSPLEDYFADEILDEEYVPQDNVFGDDVNEFQLPLDIIKNKNIKQTNKNESIITNSTPNITPNPVHNNTSTNVNTSTPTPTPTPITPSVPNPVISNNVPIVQVNTTIVSPLNDTSIPSIPKAVIPPVPKNPIIPAVPKNPVIPKPYKPQTNKESNPNQDDTKNIVNEIRSDNPSDNIKKSGSVVVESNKKGKKK